MMKNLSAFERVVRVCLGLVAIAVAALVYVHPVSRLVAGAIGLFLIWEAAAAKCPLHAMMGVRKEGERLSTEAAAVLGLVAVQAVVAYSWFFAGWEKIESGTFASGLGKTFGFFATKNPYSWYRSFLLGPAMDKSYLLGLTVQWSEVLAGFALAVGAVVLLLAKGRQRRKALLLSAIALVVGMLMNANFYLAAGWTSAGTSGDNVVMFWVQAALLYTWLATYLSVRNNPA